MKFYLETCRFYDRCRYEYMSWTNVARRQVAVQKIPELRYWVLDLECLRGPTWWTLLLRAVRRAGRGDGSSLIRMPADGMSMALLAVDVRRE
jgi:hypothetical protein